MYIAINHRIAKVDLARALRWRIQGETVVDIIEKMNHRGLSFNDYVIFSVDSEKLI